MRTLHPVTCIRYILMACHPGRDVYIQTPLSVRDITGRDVCTKTTLPLKGTHGMHTACLTGRGVCVCTGAGPEHALHLRLRLRQRAGGRGGGGGGAAGQPPAGGAVGARAALQLRPDQVVAAARGCRGGGSPPPAIHGTRSGGSSYGVCVPCCGLFVHLWVCRRGTTGRRRRGSASCRRSSAWGCGCSVPGTSSRTNSYHS